MRACRVVGLHTYKQSQSLPLAVVAKVPKIPAVIQPWIGSLRSPYGGHWVRPALPGGPGLAIVAKSVIFYCAGPR